MLPWEPLFEMYPPPKYLNAGDRAISVEFGDDISFETNRKVRRLADILDGRPIPGVIDLVPGYRSLLIHFDPLRLSHGVLKTKLAELSLDPAPDVTAARMVTDIPTVYGGIYGPDLNTVAEIHMLNPDEVVALHTQAFYRVYMIGFLPGFAYLGGLNPLLATPRLLTPRMKIPAGSVGIAGEQTGIYPSESPGGWRLIGRTPLCLFNPAHDPPALLQSGHYVRFVRIGPEHFTHICQEVRQGIYQVNRTVVPPREPDTEKRYGHD